MDEPVSAYVLGLLADLERRVVELDEALRTASQRAQAVDAELQQVARRYLTARDGARKNRDRAAHAAAEIAENNSQLARLHQDMGPLQRRADEIRDAIRQTTDLELQNQLRRRRATFLIQLEDKEKVVKKLTEASTKARDKLQKAQRLELEQSDAERLEGAALDALRQNLPSPDLFLQLFEARAGRGHCLYFLDRDRRVWQRELRDAVEPLRSMHTALRAGRYRLDQNSDVVGGRALGSVAAMYSLAALGDWNAARDLFTLVCDETLFFHQIFQVFRAWVLGLYLLGRHSELQPLLELHMYAEGVEGAYAQCFLALLKRDEKGLAMGLKNLVQGEWWQMRRTPQAALGVINVAAIALCRLAAAAKLRVPVLGPMVPTELLQG